MWSRVSVESRTWKLFKVVNLMLTICRDVTVTMMMSGGVHYDLVRDDSRLTR